MCVCVCVRVFAVWRDGDRTRIDQQQEQEGRIFDEDEVVPGQDCFNAERPVDHVRLFVNRKSRSHLYHREESAVGQEGTTGSHFQ